MNRKNYDFNVIIESLESSSPEIVYKNLHLLRTKFFKQNQKDYVSKFREKGGLKAILLLLRKPNRKIADVALSILGNCCLENESRLLVKKLDGLNIVVTVLKCIDTESIQNRVCRTLANLALDPEIAVNIHEGDVIPLIVQFLQKTKQSSSQQSAVRALRILSNSVKHRDNIVRHDGVQAISALLTSEDETLLAVVVRALAHFTQQCTSECAQQVQTGEGFSVLVTLASHENESLKQEAVLALTNLVHQGAVRPSLGNAGAITIFIKEVDKFMTNDSDDKPKHAFAITALCLCCREAVNRIRIREGGGLKQLMSLLNLDTIRENEDQRNLLISSLLNFLYDESSLEILMDLGVITTLVDILGSYIEEELSGSGDSIQEHEIEDPNVFNKKLSVENSPVGCSKAEVPEDRKCSAKSNCDNSVKKSGTKRGLDDDELNQSNNCSESKVRQTYRINSPSYQQVQKEVMNFTDPRLGSLLDDAGQWSPTSTVYSPGSPDFLSTARQGMPMGCIWASSSSPGGMSPDWIISEDRVQLAVRRGSEDDRSVLYHPGSSQSPSPRSMSPVDSPMPKYACYSPICEEEFSDQEELPDNVKNNEVPEEGNIDNDNIRESSSSRSVCPEDGSDSVDVSDPISEMIDEDQEPKRRCSIVSLPEDNPLEKWLNNQSVAIDPGPTYVNHILMILSRFSQMEKPNAALLTSTCIDALLAVLTIGQKLVSRTARILCRLARNPLCLESLILMRFPQKVALKLDETAHSTKLCRMCGSLHSLAQSLLKNLSLMAESPFGIGVLSHMFVVGSSAEKTCSTLAAPYLLSSKPLRQKIFINYRSLDSLFAILSMSTQDDFLPAVDSLVKICLQMESTFVSNNIISHLHEHSKDDSLPTSCLFEIECNRKPTDMSFVLDDGSIVEAHRELLSRTSTVFEAMLEGKFTEARREEISFGETIRPTLEFVVHYLYGCRRCSLFSFTDFNLLLDASALADRLLLNEIADFLCDEIVSTFLNADTVVYMYTFAQSHNCFKLASSVLQAILGSEFDRVGKTNFFVEVLKTDLNSILLDEVRQMILDHLPLCPSYVQV